MAEKKAKETKKVDTKSDGKECNKGSKIALFTIIGVAVVAVATFIILGVCGVFGAKVPPAGDYELVDIVKDGESQASMLSLIKAFGVSPSLKVNNDKTGKLNMTGESDSEEEVEFTEKKIKSKSSGEEVDYTYKDNKVTITADGSDMVFQKK